MMRRLAALVCWAALAASCSTGGLFRQYEYEEEMYLSLDGTTTVYVNSSVAALDALRGTSFSSNPSAAVDRDKAREWYSTPVTRVTRVTTSRRSNRRFVHVRLDVDDVRKLGDAAPFAWSVYDFKLDGNRYIYTQKVASSAAKEVGSVGWTGQEIAAFRLHLPSKVEYQNTDSPKRGNILVWEQSLDDRRKSVPLTLETRIETQSILYRTLWLFGITFVVVAVMFAGLIAWILRKGTGGSRLGIST